jgi:hypothetical protein
MKNEFRKAFILVISVVLFLSGFNPAGAYYNPSNGRFNRMDPYTGEKTQPQNLHKYIYCNNDPINLTDPMGQFGLPALQMNMSFQSQLQVHYYEAQTPMIVKISALATAVAVGATQIMSTAWDPAQILAAEDIDFQMSQRIVQTFTCTHVGGLTQDDFVELENKLKPFVRNKRRNEIPVYLHYGFGDRAEIFRQGSGLWAPSWCTKTVYSTGWEAKKYLALKRDGPRDAIYVVLPHADTKRFGPNTVKGEIDTYINGLWLPGGGKQWYFPNGTRPGTVFGPIPIPKGNF